MRYQSSLPWDQSGELRNHWLMEVRGLGSWRSDPCTVLVGGYLHLLNLGPWPTTGTITCAFILPPLRCLPGFLSICHWDLHLLEDPCATGGKPTPEPQAFSWKVGCSRAPERNQGRSATQTSGMTSLSLLTCLGSDCINVNSF